MRAESGYLVMCLAFWAEKWTETANTFFFRFVAAVVRPAVVIWLTAIITVDGVTLVIVVAIRRLRTLVPSVR